MKTPLLVFKGDEWSEPVLGILPAKVIAETARREFKFRELPPGKLKAKRTGFHPDHIRLAKTAKGLCEIAMKKQLIGKAPGATAARRAIYASADQLREAADLL